MNQKRRGKVGGAKISDKKRKTRRARGSGRKGEAKTRAYLENMGFMNGPDFIDTKAGKGPGDHIVFKPTGLYKNGEQNAPLVIETKRCKKNVFHMKGRDREKIFRWIKKYGNIWHHEIWIWFYNKRMPQRVYSETWLMNEFGRLREKVLGIKKD